MPKRKFLVATGAGYTQLTEGNNCVSVENLQVLFIGKAVDAADALRQCRKEWGGYDLRGETLIAYEVVSETSAEF